jgi:hypothetical protein
MQELAPILPVIAPSMQRFAQQILGGLIERLNARFFSALRLQVFYFFLLCVLAQQILGGLIEGLNARFFSDVRQQVFFYFIQ